MRAIRVSYVGTVILFVVSTVLAAIYLPTNVSTHFSSDGASNGAMSRGGYLVFIVVLGAVLLFLVPLMGVARAGHPGRFANIANREYWARPENRERFRTRFIDLNLVISTIAGLLLVAINVFILVANSGSEQGVAMPPWLMVVTVAFLLVVFIVAYVYFGRKQGGASSGR